VLSTGVTTKSFSTASTSTTLTPGALYKFKVEARNSVGYSVLSSAVSIIASQRPN
jgi:hypothetical protein